MITTKDVFGDEDCITVQATFTKDAYDVLLMYYHTAMQIGAIDMTETEFVGMAAATKVNEWVRADGRKTPLQKVVDAVKTKRK
jgi:hypothetical protein